METVCIVYNHTSVPCTRSIPNDYEFIVHKIVKLLKSKYTIWQETVVDPLNETHWYKITILLDSQTLQNCKEHYIERFQRIGKHYWHTELGQNILWKQKMYYSIFDTSIKLKLIS